MSGLGRVVGSGEAELSHGGFGQVAAVGDRALVVGLARTSAESRCKAAVFERIPTTSVRRLTSFVQPLWRTGGLVDQTLRQRVSGKSANAVISRAARWW